MDVDVVVIGLGPGGEYAAQKLAEAGTPRRRRREGAGRGRVPVLRLHPLQDDHPGADTLAEADRATTLAGRVDVSPDYALVANRVDKQATNHWNDESHATRLEEAGVQIVRGHGRLDGPGRVGGRRDDVRREPAASSSTPAPSRPCRRSTGWPARRTGPTAR
jgi:flavin-dependent dehydrogenase